MTDAWAEATYAGNEHAQRRRAAGRTPQERLAWLEAFLVDAERTGVLAKVRRREQRDRLAAWEQPA